MQNRNWRMFWVHAVKGLKYVVFATSLVPVFHLFLNTDFSRAGYLNGILYSTRIGFQIGLTYWALSTLVYAVTYLYAPEMVLAMRKSLSAQIIKGLSFMAIGLAISSYLEPLISGRKFGLQGAMIGFLIGGVTLLLAVFYAAYRETHQYSLELRAESAEANLHVLKNQMQPHFLFNSLNSLAELIEADKALAAVMTQKLADLYRRILENSKSQTATIESELAIVKDYLELEKLRFGERLEYSIEASVGACDAHIPSLVLQTLVENSVKHGISRSIEGGRVFVRVETFEDGLKATVSNTGSSLSDGKGTGLANTLARLDLLYGDKHGFELRDESGVVTASFWFTGVQLGA